MVKMVVITKKHLALAFFVVVLSFFAQQGVAASPFGVGKFGENVPFGSETSISIALDEEDVAIALSGGGSSLSGTGEQTVTITSTDVIGYDLYINASTATAMSNGTDTIPASANGSPAVLAMNTWGYNTTGSTSNFVGMTTTQALINSGTGPFTGGDLTAVTYGALINTSKSSGLYNIDVTYTAVGRT